MTRLRAMTLVSALIFGTALSPLQAESDAPVCPAYTFGKDYPEWVREAGQLQLQIFEDSAWRELDLQIDRLGEDGLLVKNKVAAPITPHDRLVFETREFGARAQGAPLPCGATRAWELRTSWGGADRWAYLLNCADVKPSRLREAAVLHIPGEKRINSATFSYLYHPTNQLLFREIDVFHGGRQATAARDADLQLRLDLKRFLTLSFDNRDVESVVEASTAGPLGVVGQFNFYMRLLMFKIDLKMATLASFYRNSANIPAVMEVPVDAPRRVNPGSGMLYTYNLGTTRLVPDLSNKPMPVFDPKRIKAGWQDIAPIGLGNCSGESCTFRMSGAVGEMPFGLEINVERRLAEKGFFPMYASDAAQFRHELGWTSRKEEGPRLTGIYFETSGLPKGRYKMDYWIRVGSGGGSCPAEVIHTNEPLAH